MKPSMINRQIEAAYLCCTAALICFSLLDLVNRAQAFSPVHEILVSPPKYLKAERSTFLLSRSISSPTSLSNDPDTNDRNLIDDEICLESWGHTQEWALQDNISKYTVNIPKLAKSVDNGGSNGISYAMWRSMARDTVELSGYDINFIREMHRRQLKKNKDTIAESPPGILPLLDEFEFRPNGGVAGRIQGLQGISDGTVVETSPLAQVDLTLPRGHVVTDDGTTAYELGAPFSEESFSLPKYTKDAGSVTASIPNNLMNGVDETARNVIQAVSSGDGGGDLANLGKNTAIVLGGAMAINLLSHHLTVNVFWV